MVAFSSEQPLPQPLRLPLPSGTSRRAPAKMPILAAGSLPYVLWLAGLCVVCAVLVYRTRSTETTLSTSAREPARAGVWWLG